MSVFDGFLNMMRLGPDDDDDFYDEGYEDDVEEREIIEDDFTPGTKLLIGIVIDMVIAIILTLIVFGINAWLN